MSGCIVGISGGDLLSTHTLNQYAIQQTGKKHPHVLFIPTASEDAVGYIETIKSYYQSLGCKVSTLCLISKSYEPHEIKIRIETADLIYIGGGDTEKMLTIWKKFDVDRLLIQAYEHKKVLSGISAGAICWFKSAFSDSDFFKTPHHWQYKLIDCLNVVDYVICPHYNESGRDAFDSHLDQLPGVNALALDNETAIVITDEGMFIKKSCQQANAYLIQNTASGLKKIVLQEDELIRY